MSRPGAGALVKPGSSKVLPVAPEIIRNSDGEKKQDCGLAAGKRWIAAHRGIIGCNRRCWGTIYTQTGRFARGVIKKGRSFIFTCKEESHKWLAETVGNSYLHEVREVKWGPRKKEHSAYTWKYLNEVPIRYDGKEPFMVNYFSFEIRAKGAENPSYSNSWITDKVITDKNAAYLTECGRARWKIENERHNALKNRGYNLEHNFGRGSSHAADIFFLLNLLALQFHTILEYCDLEYHLTYSIFPVRVAFFEALRVLIRRRYSVSWVGFLQYVRGKDEGPS